MKILVRALTVSMVIAVASLAQTNPLNMTTMAVVKDMGMGINLGNTFESTGNWINGNSVNAYETAWGSPTITKSMIDGYANSGFKTVRIPVAWSNLMTSNYTISTALLNRVEEVVNWVLGNNMYAIVNIHWDGGWWENFPTDSANCMNRYIRIWTQISDKFKNHSGYLVFESLNEEGVWQDVWNRYDNTGNKARAYGLLNAINQRFTTLIRNSGGNNANRHLLIAGYATDINLTCDVAFRMPTDQQNRQAVSVHYYDPFGFTHLTQNETWAQMRLTWGTTADYNELNSFMDKLKTTFVDKNIPVIVGEYGVAAPNRSESEIRNYTLAVAKAIYERNMCPVLWDVQLDANETQYYYNRTTNPPSFVDQQLVTGFRNIVGTPSSSSRPSSSSMAYSSSRPSSSSVAYSSSRPSSSSVAYSSSRPSSSSMAYSSSRPSSSSIRPSSSSRLSSSSVAYSSSRPSSSSIRPSSSSNLDGSPILLPQIAKTNSIFAMPNAVSLRVQNSAYLNIYNLSGNLQKTFSFMDGVYKVSLNDLPKGMYIVSATFDSRSETKVLRMVVK